MAVAVFCLSNCFQKIIAKDYIPPWNIVLFYLFLSDDRIHSPNIRN